MTKIISPLPVLWPQSFDLSLFYDRGLFISQFYDYDHFTTPRFMTTIISPLPVLWPRSFLLSLFYDHDHFPFSLPDWQLPSFSLSCLTPSTFSFLSPLFSGLTTTTVHLLCTCPSVWQITCLGTCVTTPAWASSPATSATSTAPSPSPPTAATTCTPTSPSTPTTTGWKASSWWWITPSRASPAAPLSTCCWTESTSTGERSRAATLRAPSSCAKGTRSRSSSPTRATCTTCPRRTCSGCLSWCQGNRVGGG